MTAHLRDMTGFYEYARVFYQNMTAFHKLDFTVPAAVRHITQTARSEHWQSLREEPSSPSHYQTINMAFVPDMIIK
jgi:hypothetical protein